MTSYMRKNGCNTESDRTGCDTSTFVGGTLYQELCFGLSMIADEIPLQAQTLRWIHDPSAGPRHVPLPEGMGT